MARTYRLLVYVATLPMLVYLWWRGIEDPAWRQRWRERFGMQALPQQQQGGVVLHCASVGEVIAARPLIEQLLADPRYLPLVLTCSTPTGSRMIAQHYAGRTGHVYFPLDLPGATRRFLLNLRPRLVLLMERELWPSFLHQAQLQGVPVVLVNARLSTASAQSYARRRALMEPAIASLRLVCAEDTVTASRLRELGVPAHRMAVTGNIKSDVALAPGLRQKIDTTRRHLGTRPVLTAGSTHTGEDEALIAAFRDSLAQFPEALLVLVPRHPERFNTVAALIERSGLRFVRHGRGEPLRADTQVLLGDTLGELMLWYGVADACFVGGSLIPRGGHNPLEVMCLEKPLIAGPFTANFTQLYTALLNEGGLLQAADGGAVLRQFGAVVRDAVAAAALVAGANAVYLRMAGATARTMAELERLAIGAPAAPSTILQGRQVLWFDPSCLPSANPQMLDIAWWHAKGSGISRTAGRGQVHRVADDHGAYLLRHYYRGGLMARVSRDLFLAQPLAQTRAMHEYDLLSRLHARGLAVPRPGAARHTRVAGLWYRADILVGYIPDATDVAQILHRERPLTATEWQLLGHTIRNLHEEQVFHSDLNCHNLMLDARGKAWIVDFDKCGFRSGSGWKQQNLDRLQRSLRKELLLDPQFHWNESDWAALLQGYHQPADTAG